MAREWLGLAACEGEMWVYAGRTPVAFDSVPLAWPHLELLNVGPANPMDMDFGGANVGSRGGGRIHSHGILSNEWQFSQGFTTPATWMDWMTYWWLVRFHTPTGSGTGSASWITSYRLGGPAAANGNVRAIINITAGVPGSLTFNVQVKTGGVWTTIGAPSASYNYPLGPGWFGLQIYRGGGLKGVRAIWQGTALMALALHASIDPTQFTVEASTGGGAISKTNAQDIDISAYGTFHSDTAELGPVWNVGGVYQNIWARYPTGDVAGGTWTVTGNAPLCPTDKWRALDDPEDTGDQPSDYIIDPGPVGTQRDQLFTFAALPVGAVLDPGGVGIWASIHCAAPAAVPSDVRFLANDTVTTITATPSAAASGDGFIGQFLTAPDGGTWTKAKYDACRFGIRAVAGRSVVIDRVHGLATYIFGNNFGRPTKAVACPSLASLLQPGSQPVRRRREVVAYHHH